MRIAFRYSSVASLALVLVACSSSSKTYFQTEGLRAPVTACLEEPTHLGQMSRMADIDEGNGCEVQNRYDVRSLAEVNFSQPATLNCGMVSPLHSWLEGPVQSSSEKHFGSAVATVTVAASYSCRPRNNKRGAKMSEHGYGNALDIAAFTLADGRTISVEDDYYKRGDTGAFLKEVRSAACGTFATVLGPGSDAAHRNHFHFDLQNRKSGQAYCH